MHSNFSVLQSVYQRDNPRFLAQSLQSIAESTCPPAQIILVKDGVLSPVLDSVIAKWRGRLPLFVVGYEQNQGLGYALSYGLQFVQTELVCRMDSDDICVPTRFEKQIAFMESHPKVALCSGFIAEFSDSPDVVESIRAVPLTHDEIVRRLKRRNAFNHMAVCFRKSAVQMAGGYQNVPYFEDYDLWVRMVQYGCVTANLPYVLVNARIGNDMIGRRQGLSYARHEMHFLRRQLKSGFLNWREFLLAVILRVPCRLLPKKVLMMIYHLIRRKNIGGYRCIVFLPSARLSTGFRGGVRYAA